RPRSWAKEVWHHSGKCHCTTVKGMPESAAACRSCARWALRLARVGRENVERTGAKTLRREQVVAGRCAGLGEGRGFGGVEASAGRLADLQGSTPQPRRVRPRLFSLTCRCQRATIRICPNGSPQTSLEPQKRGAHCVGGGTATR